MAHGRRDRVESRRTWSCQTTRLFGAAQGRFTGLLVEPPLWRSRGTRHRTADAEGTAAAGAVLSGVEPIDHRITAAKLVTLRDTPGAEETIADLLGVNDMAPNLAVQTLGEVGAFLRSGSAIDAAQLIHAASVRRSRSLAASKKTNASGAAPGTR